MPRWRTQLLWAVFLLIFINSVTTSSDWIACPELSPVLRLPCKCRIEQIAVNGQSTSIGMDCDRIIFTSESPQIPKGAPISTFTQRYSGQHLPIQTFATSNLPITKLDFSHNSIRRLADKAFNGIQDTLLELRLSNNLLGDSLNPIFSTIEFTSLVNLQVLDLASNKIRGIERGLLRGCEKLQEFVMDGNSLTEVPSNSLNGPSALRIISIRSNLIKALKNDAFSAQPFLERIDLRRNRIDHIDGGSFANLEKIREIYLAGNLISRLNSDVFHGLSTLQKLDLSENFFTSFPIVALREIENLKVLNLSSNMIKNLDSTHLQTLKSIQILDMSRNDIASIPPGTFREQKALKFLDLSLNSLRTIEDDALEGLNSLQTLIIRDNNILLIPGSALGRLPKLSNLYLDYNRVAALSSDILGSLQPEDIRYMSLSRNVIRELPGGSFQMFKNLLFLDLSGNSLATIYSEMFIGLENSLIELKIGQNKITNVGNIPLSLRKLRKLDLSQNNIVDIPTNAFEGVNQLMYLNISNNNHLAPVPVELIQPLTKLQIFDVSNVGLKSVFPEMFSHNPNLRAIYLKNNKIQELPEGTFNNMRNLTVIDLSYNKILTIKPATFINVMNLKELSLKGNQLNAFKGEIFNTGTSLEELDISENQLGYLSPTSFRIHPRLRKLVASNNKFGYFPASTIQSLQFLEFIDLSNNELKTVEELDFARLPRLRQLILSNNALESLSEMAFHNSSQLQYIDLSHNKLERLAERTFEGLTRIEVLNLDSNNLSEIPDALFERSRLQMLENVILSNNKFEVAPLKALHRQYFFVSFVDLSHNKLRELPTDDTVMINVKKLDLSYNPLSNEAVKNILSEPKTIRELNLAGTGISQITSLETPFLQALNLSNNNINTIDEQLFDRASLLQSLDLSNNFLSSFKSLSMIWPKLTLLQSLNLSNNPFENILQGDFDNLEMLRSLSIHSLEKCSRIERNAFKNIPNLSKLDAYNYPRLGYLDVKGILNELPGLENLDIEIKDQAVGSDQLQPNNHPRLRELGLRGYRLKTISSSSLAGLKSRDLFIKLRNTSLTNLQPALLFPVPRSSNLHLDVSGSMLTVLSPQLLSALEDRRNSLTLSGLENNPIHCDCNSRALRRWLPTSHMSDIKCVTPDDLHGRLLVEVGDDELTCSPRKVTTDATTLRQQQEEPETIIPQPKPSSRILVKATTQEPDIIWSVPQITQSAKIKTKSPPIKQTLTNDDTLIIGIVGGVVAFIAILIIVICIVRLRMTGPHYPTHLVGIPPMTMGPGSVQLNYKSSPPTLYGVPAYATQSYATLPHKISSSSQASLRQSYATMGRMSANSQQQQQQQPYYIYQEEKAYR
ncbi:hypothetical protein PVAND_001879 [Polypedilum vanderplanki]|uniref:LRRCT domain-containing protein n=1 Tax=Polypedilum vanderplanki TaxID=319348 RepID=A0A9J6BQM5_POLVA|nr:hypothetical protein PVAND_001879 [Polypedilum vanderplanki]